MAKIRNITIAGPDVMIYTSKWVISKQGPPKLDKADDKANIKAILVHSPEKMPNQKTGYSINTPRLKDITENALE